MSYEQQFLQALALTVAVECSVIVVLVRFLPALRRYALPLTNVIAAGTIPSAATLPYLWFIVPSLHYPYVVQLIAGELAVFAVEIVIIKSVVNLPVRWCALLSLAANSASIVAGLGVFR